MKQLVETLSALLAERHMTLSAAESCTGGLIAKSMTDRSGASGVFRGGVVSYVNDVKRNVLGVAQQTLDAHGAVSEIVARAMAEGCRKLCGSDLAVSVTGVAGPDRDDRGNRVGTVYIALAHEGGTACRRFAFGEEKSREAIRTAAAWEALDMARRYLAGEKL